MKGCTLVLLSAVFLFSTFGISTLAAGNSYVLQKQVTLYKGQGFTHPYTLFYDITIDQPGEVRIAFETGIPAITHGRFLGLRIGAKGKLGTNEIKHYSKECLCFFGKTQMLIYAVDALSLERAGHVYRVFVSNYGSNTLKGNLVVSYPDHTYRPKADLTIEKIYIGSNKKVGVVVKNTGEGVINSALWYYKMDSRLDLTINERYWGGIAISKLDPERKLQLPGGTVTYGNGPVITTPTIIKATIDAQHKLYEAREDNNAMTVTLPLVLKPVHVAKPIKPIMTIKFPDLAPEGDLIIGKRDRTVAWGNQITLTPADAKNIANGAADFDLTFSIKDKNGAGASSFKVKVLFKTSPVGHKDNQSVESGSLDTIHMAVHLPLTQGNLKLRIDPGNDLKETDEDNNNTHITLKFQGF